MTSSTITNIVETIADTVQEALRDAENAYWYRRKMDRSGWEILFSTPEQYQWAGEGKVIAKRKHVEAAQKYTERQRALFIAQAILNEAGPL